MNPCGVEATTHRPDTPLSTARSSTAADNGFQSWHTEYEIAAYDVEDLVHYRGSSPKAALNNALNRANGYTQRWMAETSYSTTKRSLGKARHPGCNAHDSASFAHGPVNATCSVARATHRSLAPHILFHALME